MRAYEDKFVAGAVGKGVPRAVAERVYGQIVGFSGFGFPKAHSAAFGLLAYQSTWLRVHYGPEFLCSLLNEQPMGFYPPDLLVHEAQRRGIEIPPRVQRGAVECRVETREPAPGPHAPPAAAPGPPVAGVPPVAPSPRPPRPPRGLLRPTPPAIALARVTSHAGLPSRARACAAGERTGASRSLIAALSARLHRISRSGWGSGTSVARESRTCGDRGRARARRSLPLHRRPRRAMRRQPRVARATRVGGGVRPSGGRRSPRGPLAPGSFAPRLQLGLARIPQRRSDPGGDDAGRPPYALHHRTADPTLDGRGAGPARPPPRPRRCWRCDP